jgi:predicted transcriptional regulator
MAVELTLTLDDEVYAKVQRLAARRHTDVSEVVAQVLDDLLLTGEEAQEADWAEPNEAVERERQAYIAMHNALKAQYLGKYVAIYGGELIDWDDDELALYLRIDAQYPDDFVWLTKVEEEPISTLVFRSPRFVYDQ